jgi:hypothetical protein
MKSSISLSAIAIAAALLAAIPSSKAEAGASVPHVFVATADAQGIPPTLLYAIALQESGRKEEGTGAFKPWPWSLNVGGKPHYYANMEEAWNALNTLFQDPPRNIDIGLVQVSWPVNSHVIHDPFLALEPTINLAIGAQILRECFDRLGDWWAAVGCYHSPTPKRAAAYRDRVQNRWLRLTGRRVER